MPLVDLFNNSKLEYTLIVNISLIFSTGTVRLRNFKGKLNVYLDLQSYLPISFQMC